MKDRVYCKPTLTIEPALGAFVVRLPHATVPVDKYLCKDGKFRKTTFRKRKNQSGWYPTVKDAIKRCRKSGFSYYVRSLSSYGKDQDHPVVSSGKVPKDKTGAKRRADRT